MLTYELTFDNEFAAMRRYGLTPNELFVARLLLMYQDSKYGVDYLHKFVEINGLELVRTTIMALQEKGLILKNFTMTSPISVMDIPINKIATKFFYRAALDMGKELFDIYPNSTYINGSLVPLKGVSKRFNSIEDAFETYGRSIKWNPETHNQILELTKWAAENTGMINCTFSSYIIDRKWEFLNEVRNGDNGNINFDTVRML